MDCGSIDSGLGAARRPGMTTEDRWRPALDLGPALTRDLLAKTVGEIEANGGVTLASHVQALTYPRPIRRLTTTRRVVSVPHGV
ncbi:hypothetical protein AYJ54_09475 [Bradyrhizobium centrolobii]|uniref:Uncharacterized protein n=1 Tax=Bradyrhizobium centrolobii TaxID=1505087 RepID=A0A176YUB8_9BRAD|nr:hypothetical protein [Bradyrhizobium centrolobii]OAF10508.1 hypothetical protein AYJ54_09475 [Bradyrhizobium centrolobii]